MIGKRLSTLALVGSFTLPCFAAGGGLAIVDVQLTDNGDHDGFADTRETVELWLTVKNTTSSPIYGEFRLFNDDPALACLSLEQVDIGILAAGEVRQLSEPFVFTVSDIDRAGLGLGPWDPFYVTFRVHVTSPSVPAFPDRLSFDLDLNVTGGSGPAGFFESFEGSGEGSLGAFETENLDAGLHHPLASNGYRCQYTNPATGYSTAYANPWDFVLGGSEAHAAEVHWSLSGPGFSPLGGRGFTGFRSLFFGEDLGPPSNWTTPTQTLEAVRTTEPINLGWGFSPELSFRHMVSFVDSRSTNTPAGQTVDRGVVMAQVADDAGNPVGPWLKLHPYQNGYDQRATDAFSLAMFDPVDDGNDEDDLFDPACVEVFCNETFEGAVCGTSPCRGPSSTCGPEPVFSVAGETSDPFDVGHHGLVEGPGLQGGWGVGTWVETKVDLERLRGRRVRLRFLASTFRVNGLENWEEVYEWNPLPGDDGWWIDDVTVSGALTEPATVTVDSTDNSGLPSPTDDDQDSVGDTCDNCTGLSNSSQADLDLDGVGDACDVCPAEPDNVDPDLDQFCASDNCPSVTNADQADGDEDGAGAVCDCNDLLAATHPGATEVNDGFDNNCPGDAGYGAADELSGSFEFYNPFNLNEISWPQQDGASSYQLARATDATFSVGCALFNVPVPAFQENNPMMFNDPFQPAPDGVAYYLVRPRAPHVGSWGLDSAGTPRVVGCAP